MLNSSRDKTKARTVVERGEKGPLCDPASELLLTRTGSARVMRRYNEWDDEGKKKGT